MCVKCLWGFRPRESWKSADLSVPLAAEGKLKLIGEFSNPLSQNRYTYCHNNPYKYDDPTEHLPASGINKYAANALMDDAAIGAVLSAALIFGLGLIKNSITKMVGQETAGHVDETLITI